MPMDGNMMGDAILAAMALVPFQPNSATYRQALFRALATAVVQHIQTHAQVNSTVAVTSVTAVTPGVGVSGPGAGTATGTVS